MTPTGGTGLNITNVTPGSLAAQVGFQPEDRILTVNGRPVRSNEELELLLQTEGRPGQSVAIRIERKGQQQILQLPGERIAQLLPTVRSHVPDGVPGGAAMGLTLDQRGALNVVVAQVEPNSPAASAGLQPGDQILAILGQPITTIQQVRRAVTLAGVGDTLRLSYDRGGRHTDVNIPLSSYATVFGTRGGEAIAQRTTGPALGIRVAQDTSGGVVVTEVQPNSPAEQAGIRAGDQIVSAQDVPVRTPAALAALVDQAGEGASLPVVYRRNGQDVRVTPRVGDFAQLYGAARAVASTQPAVGIRVRENPQGGPPVVTEVAPNSPAARAGLQPGDQVVAIDGQAVNSTQDVFRGIQRAGAGSAVQIRYSRDGRVWQTNAPVSNYAAIYGTQPGGIERQVGRQPLEGSPTPPTPAPPAQPQRPQTNPPTPSGNGQR